MLRKLKDHRCLLHQKLFLMLITATVAPNADGEFQVDATGGCRAPDNTIIGQLATDVDYAWVI